MDNNISKGIEYHDNEFFTWYNNWIWIAAWILFY